MSGRWVLVVVGLVLLVVTLGVGRFAGATGACGFEIVELELAGTDDRADELLEPCRPADVDEVREAVAIDSYAFVPLYVTAISWWCVLRRRTRPMPGSRADRLAALAIGAAVVAGALDLVENGFLYNTVTDAGGASWTTAATVAATAKFAVLLFAIPVSLTNLVRCVRLGPTEREPHS